MLKLIRVKRNKLLAASIPSLEGKVSSRRLPIMFSYIVELKK